jgi:hypothetical protein
VRRLLPLIPALAILAMPAGADAAKRATEQVTSAAVTAELSYVKRPNPLVETEYRDLRVKIVRLGVTMRDEKVGGVCAIGCSPALAHSGGKSIRLRDLDGDGEPDVLVDLFTGGASCCLYSIFYGFRAESSSYTRDAEDFGTYGYRLLDRDRDGVLELKGGDVGFRGAFGCNACGPQPIRIWQYRDGKLRKATRDFKGLVRADARRARRGYLRNRQRGAEYAKSFLTPYAADLCLLGQCGKGLRTVRGAIRRGELSHRSDLDTPPYGNEFLAALRRLLRRYGYLP